MHRSAFAGLLALALSACGGGGGDSGGSNANLPANAVSMQTTTTGGMKKALVRMTASEAALLFMLDPGTPLTPNVAVAPDMSAGAAPFSVTVSGNLDGGFDEPAQVAIAGKATYASDPSAAPFTSVSGQLTIDVTLLGLLTVYHADLAFGVGANERRLSGSGVLRNPLTGNETTLTVDAAHPLVLVPASGATANACRYAIDGDVRVVAVGALGTYASTWHFTPGNGTVAVDTATHTDGAGNVTTMPAIDVDLRCNPAGSGIADWVGVYQQVWGCLPYEQGGARLALTMKDATTVTINDEDPPGSGNGNVYEASIVGGSVRSLRGSFLAGPVGFRYREDFVWTLSPDRQRFFQTSRYVYQDGPYQGSGGNCFARAVRQ
jgi:hypothetical protein